MHACAWRVPNMGQIEAVIPGTRLDPCSGFPSHLLPSFSPILVIPFSWLLGPATLSFCLSQCVPVCSVSGKRMSCPDSGNAQSIEIPGLGGLGPWLLLEKENSGRLALWNWGLLLHCERCENRDSPRLGQYSDSWVHSAGPWVTPAPWVGVSHPRKENPGGLAFLSPCSAYS